MIPKRKCASNKTDVVALVTATFVLLNEVEKTDHYNYIWSNASADFAFYVLQTQVFRHFLWTVKIYDISRQSPKVQKPQKWILQQAFNGDGEEM